MRNSRQSHLEDMNWADYSDASDRESLERVIAADSMQRPRDRKSVPELRREAHPIKVAQARFHNGDRKPQPESPIGSAKPNPPEPGMASALIVGKARIIRRCDTRAHDFLLLFTPAAPNSARRARARRTRYPTSSPWIRRNASSARSPPSWISLRGSRSAPINSFAICEWSIDGRQLAAAQALELAMRLNPDQLRL